MASYRIGIGSFNLKDGAVGIGTESTGLGNLKVEGTIKTTDFDVTGVSTFTRYSGLNADQFNINRDTTFDNKETVTYTVTVAGGIFYIDGVSAPRLELKRGSTYIFDQSEGTNSGHPLRFKDRAGESYYDGVSVDGTPGSSGAFTQLKVNVNAPDTLRYYCTVHGNGMGNIISVVDSTFYSLQNIGDVVVGDDNILSVGSGSTSFTGVFDYVCVKHHFSVPTGDTAGRDKSSGYGEGTIRFNRDLDTMEFFNGDEWRQFSCITDMKNSRSARGRAIISGSYPSNTSQIDYFNIAIKSNSVDFGDLQHTSGLMDACSSSTRYLISPGYDGDAAGTNQIEYVTMASTGNAIDFGDTNCNTYGTGACSNSTRGIIMGGNRMPADSPFNDGNDGNNVIDQVEISTLGNAIDFGDLTNRRAYPASCGSTVRGVVVGGYNNAIGHGGLVTTDTFLFSSSGNSIDFGNMQDGGARHGASNMTTAIFSGTSGGSNTYANILETISIQTLGNALDFGDSTWYGVSASASSQTRFVNVGGRDIASPYGNSNIIEFVEFSSLGNAQDFGDLGFPAGSADNAGSSDCHGGLGGY